ncbi:MAG: molybdopterin-guanine dinucleotide biosynthesis protein MobB [Blautia sp.]|nr:molybdopterin-guanine dinucleotide biosynthesis protein MobB [Blautia sp.]MDY3716177.1 molybdopterin-guanine dinucleotide biosynthesis protein MobB [Blautia sp.]
MKVITLVGVRKSGKTTTVTGLIREMKKRGYRVGTVKSVFCPEFSMDTKDSNTWKHREAGADLVCVKGKKETDLLLPPCADGDWYESLPVDYLLLEGEYELQVPRIICARKEEEIDERCTEDTIGIAGRIAEQIQTYKDIPVYHSVNEIGKLADLLEKQPETEFPIKSRPMLQKAAAHCQCGCDKIKGTNPQKAAVLEAHPVNTERKHIFLTGEKGIGKTTLLKKLLAAIETTPVGFVTLPYEIHGVQKGYYMHSLRPMEAYENDSPVVIRRGETKMIPVWETFETLGLAILEQSKKEPQCLAVMDELGKAEKKAIKFQEAVFSVLDSQSMVVGILQKNSGKFTEAIAGRPDVEVYEVTEENRETLYPVLLEKLQNCDPCGL